MEEHTTESEPKIPLKPTDELVVREPPIMGTNRTLEDDEPNPSVFLSEIEVDLFEDFVNASKLPVQVKKVLIAKSQPLWSQDLAINAKTSIPQNPPREETPLLEKFSDTNGLDFQFHKRPSSEYNSNPYEKESLKECPYSQWEELKNGMSSDVIEG